MGRRRVLLGAVALLLLTTSTVARSVLALAQEGSSASASIDDADLGWGESTTVRGAGWDPGARIDIILFAGGHTLATPTAADDGTIEATITIPQGLGSSADYKLAVQGGAADGSYGYITIDVKITGPTPEVSVADRELAWGDVTRVSGARFKPGAKIKVSLLPDNKVLAETTAGDDTGFAADITVPSGLRSSKGYQIVVQGQGVDLLFHYLPTEVTIVGPRPTTSVSPTRLAWGQATQVHGDLWKAGTTVQIDVLPDTIRVGEAAVGADGTFDITVRAPADLPTSDRYFLVATGTGADGHFAYIPQSLTIIGDRPFVDVSTNRPGRGGSVRVEAHRFQPGTDAELTLVPGFERLGKETVGEDGTFTTTVRIPDDAAYKDPHALVVTGLGHDGLFAYVPTEMILGGGGATPPAGAIPRIRPPGSDDEASGARPALDEDGFSEDALPAPDGSPTNVFLAILLAVLTALTIAILLLASRKDLREAVARRWSALVARLPHPRRPRFRGAGPPG